MAEPVGNNSDQPERRPRCVLLVDESGAVPSSLVAALDRRGLQVVITRQPPEVLLELAQSTPTGTPGTAPGTAPGMVSETAPGTTPATYSDTSVVVVEPDQQPRIDELREAMASYFPLARCWRYDPRGIDGHASLTTFADPPHIEPPTTDDDEEYFDDDKLGDPPDAPEPPDSPAYVRSAGHRLRSIVVRADPAHRDPQGPLVTEEELAMLLDTEAQPAPLRKREGE